MISTTFAEDEYNWADLLPYMTEEEIAFVHRVYEMNAGVWSPLDGPQRIAYESTADVIGYGGAAGGGKTDLMCGSALTKHQKSLIVRREGTQLTGIIDRLTELLNNNKDGYNGQEKIWRLKGDAKNPYRQIEFGSTPNADDWNKYQGRPRDFLGVDEAANFLELQVRMLIGWVRSVDPNQICQTLLAFNPPTTVEGRWIIKYFAPWIDKKYHGQRAEPGEIRHFAMLGTNQDGVAIEEEVEDSTPFVQHNGERIYDFDPKDFQPTEIIMPQSRTFIPSRITDNPYLMGTGYMSQLQALPEPLRSQMLNGDFTAGMTDDPWQVIPTAWVDAAQERWRQHQDFIRMNGKGEMDSLGCDVARGGKDKTIIARRHGWWFDELVCYPGSETPDGPIVAGYVISNSRDRTPQHIDVIGVGASPYDFLVKADQPVYGVDVRESAPGTDESGLLTFKNLRSALWWWFREKLDPKNGYNVMLPPDDELAVELCTPKWSAEGKVIKVQSRDEIYEKLKKSVDKASAVLLASIETPKMEVVANMGIHGGDLNDYNPYDDI